MILLSSPIVTFYKSSTLLLSPILVSPSPKVVYITSVFGSILSIVILVSYRNLSSKYITGLVG